MKAKKINVEYVLDNFRLVDNVIERYSMKTKCWQKVVATPAKDGYCSVCIGGVNCGVTLGSCMYHRLVWVLVYKEDIPEGMQIDHINGIRSDNRIENLRIVSKRQNDQNKKVHRDGHLKGTFLINGSTRYGAQIQIDYKRVSLGRYPNEEDAQTAYLTACQHVDEYMSTFKGDSSAFRKYIRGLIGYGGDDAMRFIRIASSKFCPYIYINQTQIGFSGYSTVLEAQKVRDFALANMDKFIDVPQFKQYVLDNYKEG